MKILFAVKSMDHYTGGAERVLAQVSSGLAARGHAVTLLSFDAPGGESIYPLDKKVRRLTLGIGDITRPAHLFETIRRMAALRRTVQEMRPDVAVGFMHSMFVPLGFALIGTDIPVVASEHIVPQHYKHRPLQFFLLRLSRFVVNQITVLSEPVKALYPAAMQRKMTVVPNPVSAPTAFAAPGAEVTPKIILNVGRCDPQKNQAVLIDAFALLAGKFPDWNLRIVGEGPLRPALQKRANGAGLGTRIDIPGTRRDIEKEYTTAHIFALPSSYESFGLATAEALAHGLPAIGFQDCPGTNELIRDGVNGYLVPGNAPAKNFAAALEKLMENANLRARMGETARGSLAQLGEEAVLERWEALLARAAQ